MPVCAVHGMFCYVLCFVTYVILCILVKERFRITVFFFSGYSGIEGNMIVSLAVCSLELNSLLPP
jgi:hypothetical protein